MIYKLFEFFPNIPSTSGLLWQFIIWRCLKRTGNNQIQELDWLKSRSSFSHLDRHLDWSCFSICPQKLQTNKKKWLFLLIPREARPKASRSGVYNFVPQRAQAGWNLVWSLRSCIFISLFIYLWGVCRKWRHTAARWWPNRHLKHRQICDADVTPLPKKTGNGNAVGHVGCKH